MTKTITGRGTRNGSNAGSKKTPPRRTAAFVERACRGVFTLARLRQGEMQDGLLSAGFAGFAEARKPALRRTVGGGAAGEGEPTYERASGRCHPKASGSYRTGQFQRAERTQAKSKRDGTVLSNVGRKALGESKGPSEREALASWSGPRHTGASMRVTLALAALPLAVFCLTPRAPARVLAPRAPTPVVSEGVRVIPLEAFNARWWPDQAPPSIRVTTVPVRVLTNEKPSEPVVEPAGVAAALPPPVSVMKRAALQTDICARHGMRKVVVVRGKWKGWRCRRG